MIVKLLYIVNIQLINKQTFMQVITVKISFKDFKKILSNSGLKITDLSRMTGITRVTLYKMLKDDGRITDETWKRISKAIDEHSKKINK